MVVFEWTANGKVLLLVLAVSYIVYLFRLFKSSYLIESLAHKSQMSRLWSGLSKTRNQMSFLGTTFCYGLLVLILLRPKWDLVKHEVIREGRNVIFALDLSRSMLAKDLMPSRLELSKLKIRDIFNKLGPERFGLIFFSDKAYLHCPFTTDRLAFFSFLDQADSSTTSGGGTCLAKALDESIYTFQSVFPNLKKRIVVLITDSEDFSPDIESAIAEAKKANINVIILVSATETGAPVPIVDCSGREIGHEKDLSGAIVMTKINSELINKLSKKLGAKVVPICNNDTDIDEIVDFVKQFEKEKFDNKNVDIYKEQQSLFSGLFCIVWALLWLF